MMESKVFGARDKLECLIAGHGEVHPVGNVDTHRLEYRFQAREAELFVVHNEDTGIAVRTKL